MNGHDANSEPPAEAMRNVRIARKILGAVPETRAYLPMDSVSNCSQRPPVDFTAAEYAPEDNPVDAAPHSRGVYLACVFSACSTEVSRQPERADPGVRLTAL
jgi:hypothetical protein